MTKTIDQYAASKGVDLRCLIACHEDGSKEYVLAAGKTGQPVYAHTSAELISARIDRAYAERLFGSAGKGSPRRRTGGKLSPGMKNK